MPKFTIPNKKKLDKDENFIKFEIPTDPIQSICGQEKVKRAIEISLAGEYPLCIYGPSGQGKTQLISAYRDMYMKIYRRKVPYSLYDIDGYPTENNASVYVKIDKLPYSTINKGFNGLTSKEIVSKINKRLLTTDLFITPDFWDILGQTYSRDALTPKQVFSALKVARTIANLEQSEIITRAHFKEALVLVTFPQLKAEKESAKEVTGDSNLC